MAQTGAHCSTLHTLPAGGAGAEPGMAHVTSALCMGNPLSR